MKKKGNKKWLVAGGLTLAAGGLAFLGYRLFRNQKTRQGVSDLRASLVEAPQVDIAPLIAASVAKQTSPSLKSSGFPLKRGSKGELVKQLQRVIVQKYGKEALPRFGVDGVFGREVEAWLVSVGHPRRVDIATFSKILASSKPEDATVSWTKVGNSLAKATMKYGLESRKDRPDFDLQTRSWAAVKRELKLLFKPEHYKLVSNTYKQHRILGVRRTLVTGLLGFFKSKSQRDHLESEFLRIGLLKSGSRWSIPE